MRPACIFGSIILLAVWLLDPFARAASDAMLRLTVIVLQALGIIVETGQGALSIGRLTVPWTAECAGVSALMILAMLVLWTHRVSTCSPLTILHRLVLVLPVAVLVNIARVLTVIAYRQTFFPEVESPQLHALMGLVWLLPAVALFVPRHSLKTGKSVLLEAVHLAAIIALLTPLVAGPGALIIAACTTMVWLERSKTAGAASSTFAGILWLLAGTLFASMAMESLWLAWLLACPWNGGLRWRRPSTAILLAGTMPLLSMRPAFAVVVGIAFAWNAWAAWLQPQNKFITLRPQPAVPPLRWAGFFALALAFVMPFAASAVSRRHAPLGTPPGTLHPKSLAPGHYELHLQDQPAAVRIDWFEPQGGGRHHTLAVCMRYRGCILSETPGQPDILTDGDCWRREYFLVGDHLCHGYREYLFKTMIPGSPTGAHLILATRCASMTGREFATISDALVRQIHEQVSAAPATIARS